MPALIGLPLLTIVRFWEENTYVRCPRNFRSFSRPSFVSFPPQISQFKSYFSTIAFHPG